MRRSLLWLTLGSIANEAHSRPTHNHQSDTVKVQWVGDPPVYTSGTTFGVPWRQGKYTFNDTLFSITEGSNKQIPLQSWVTGYWRDGSIKWTGHAIPPLDSPDSELTVRASSSAYSKRTTNSSNGWSGVEVANRADEVSVDTGKITVSFPKQGSPIICSIKTADGKVVGENGKLVLHSQSGVAEDVAARTNSSIDYFNFESNVEEVTVDSDTSVRAVITVKGGHKITNGGDHDDWLQFTLRFTYIPTRIPSGSSTALCLTEKRIRTLSAAWEFSCKFPWPARNYTIATSDYQDSTEAFFMKLCKGSQVCVGIQERESGRLNSKENRHQTWVHGMRAFPLACSTSLFGTIINRVNCPPTALLSRSEQSPARDGLILPVARALTGFPIWAVPPKEDLRLAS